MFTPGPAPTSGTSRAEGAAGAGGAGGAGAVGGAGAAGGGAGAAGGGAGGAVGGSLPAEVYAATVGPAILELVQIRAQIAALQAREQVLLNRCDTAATVLARDDAHTDHGDHAHRSLAAEIGFALRESDRAMLHKIARATTLVEHYPAVHAALREGRISQGHATVICDAGEVIGTGDDEATVMKRAFYERQVLEVAVTESTGRLRPIAKGQAEAHAARSLDERHADAVRGRRVVLVERPEGMADIVATVPAVYGKGIMDRLDQIGWAVKNANRQAKAAAAGAAARPDVSTGVTGEAFVRDERSLDEIRTDAFVEMLLGADASKIATTHGKGLAAIQARVQVIVPEMTLTRREDAGSAGTTGTTGHDANTVPDTSHIPTELIGYGPIDTGTARSIAGLTASWDRVMVSVLTGDVLSVDRYRPSAAIKRFLAARDLRCRAPGCNVMVARSDIDHTLEAALGGETSIANLGTACKYHHVMKHRPGWKLTQKPGGVMEWETPLGNSYVDRPGGSVRFRRYPPDTPEPPDRPDDEAPPDSSANFDTAPF